MATYPDAVDFSTFATYQPLSVDGSTLFGGAADLDASWTPITGVRAVSFYAFGMPSTTAGCGLLGTSFNL